MSRSSLDSLPGGAKEGLGGGPVADLLVEQRRSAEARVVEERVDAACPGAGVQVGLGMVPIAWGCSVGGAVAGGLVSHVDGDVEMLWPQVDGRHLVLRPGRCSHVLEQAGRERVPP